MVERRALVVSVFVSSLIACSSADETAPRTAPPVDAAVPAVEASVDAAPETSSAEAAVLVDATLDAVRDAVSEKPRDAKPEAPYVDPAVDAGKGTGSLACSGTGWVEVADAWDLDVAGDWTAEMWFKDTDNYEHNARYLMAKDDGVTGNFMIATEWRKIGGGELVSWANQVASYDLGANGFKGTDWHHVAVVFQPASAAATLYLDGALKATQSGLSWTAGSTKPLGMCARSATDGEPLKGALDDVRMWQVARTAEQIAAHYKTQITGDPDLVANWTFDDGSGTTAKDATGNGHDATLHTGTGFSTDVHP
jgi:hypothetical protein